LGRDPRWVDVGFLIALETLHEGDTCMSSKRLLWIAALLALVPTWAMAQGFGNLSGTVTGPDSAPMSGVTVVVNEVGMAEITDANGNFELRGLPAGTYTVSFSLGERISNVEGVAIAADQTADLDHNVDWDVSYAETITVFSASRRRERVVEAPAAVTVIAEEQLERESPHGQLAKVVEFTPGAQVTQSGLYDFNLNTRGFNSSLNRRVPALVDGRDATVPFLMSNDWPSMSSMGDMASVELIRGPSSALYGTNAFNGILVLTTKQPRYSEGGTAQLTAGELSTFRGDLRWSGGLTDNDYIKLNGSYTSSDDFYRTRVPALTGGVPEYSRYCTAAGQVDCLVPEGSPLALTEDELWLAGIRYDHYFEGSFMTLEGGTSYAEGPVLQTGIGRVQVQESDRPWLRFNFSHPHFNFLAYQNKRDAPTQRALSRGPSPVGFNNLVLDEENWAGEAQGNFQFAESKGHVVGGLSYREEEVDTAATLTSSCPFLSGNCPRTVGADRQAAYGQVEYAFSPRFKAVVAGRYDQADNFDGDELYDGQFSPKVAFVIAPSANHTIRLTYNEAFQSPNFSELYLASPAGNPANLTLAAIAANPAFAALAPVMNQLGFGAAPVLARGNNDLEIEEIKTAEIGYSGILGGKVFMTVDYYQSEIENFVTDLIRGVNPAFAPYRVPPALGLPAQATVPINAFAAAVPGLAILANGQPAIVTSYTNAGTVETEGIDFGLNVFATNTINFAINYSWFDFEVTDFGSLTGAARDQLLPNSPENSASGTLGFTFDRWNASIGYRWVDDFRWAAGVFVGDVPSYDTIDINANWDITEHFRLGLNVTNALDDEHYQTFGGDILGRRALGSVTFNW
jgi:outer membrane receptor for ferrienterochelin and colicins